MKADELAQLKNDSTIDVDAMLGFVVTSDDDAELAGNMLEVTLVRIDEVFGLCQCHPVVAVDLGMIGASLAKARDHLQGQLTAWRGEVPEWRIVRIVKEMLPIEFLTPDNDKIEAVRVARRHDEHPPVIPGVIFEEG
jgi:hypothetical protein